MSCCELCGQDPSSLEREMLLPKFCISGVEDGAHVPVLIVSSVPPQAAALGVEVYTSGRGAWLYILLQFQLESASCF